MGRGIYQVRDQDTKILRFSETFMVAQSKF